MTAASAPKLEQRIALLEAEVAQLKARLDSRPQAKDDWLDKVCGSFANDPAHEEAMRLGRKYRESLRPGKKKKAKKR